MILFSAYNIIRRPADQQI